MNDIILQVQRYINHTKKIVKNSVLKTIQIAQIQINVLWYMLYEGCKPYFLK